LRHVVIVPRKLSTIARDGNDGAMVVVDGRRGRKSHARGIDLKGAPE
jgi:hypothetical protein